MEHIPVAAISRPGTDWLLAGAVGVQVPYGGLGSFSTMSIRGSTAEQVQVYLDGVPLNQALGGGVDLGELSLAGVESIEVYRGAVPARFGGNSIGGVVNIRTRRPGKGSVFGLQVGGGSFATHQLSVTTSSTWKAPELLGLLAYSATRTDFRLLHVTGAEFTLHAPVCTRRANSDYHSLNSLVKVARPGAEPSAGPYHPRFGSAAFRHQQQSGAPYPLRYLEHPRTRTLYCSPRGSGGCASATTCSSG